MVVWSSDGFVSRSNSEDSIDRFGTVGRVNCPG
jgi:hypothetical protein